VPDKENTKCFTGTKNFGVVRRGNGFSHDLDERSPSRFSGEAFTVLLGAGFLLLYIFILHKNSLYHREY
jgi:hypothetical protein